MFRLELAKNSIIWQQYLLCYQVLRGDYDHHVTARSCFLFFSNKLDNFHQNVGIGAATTMKGNGLNLGGETNGIWVWV